MTTKEIENIFTYHKPFGDQAARYERIRADAKALAYTNLQQAVMWANAGIAINETE